MFSEERMIMIACCGRPLWGAHYGEHLKKIYNLNPSVGRKTFYNDISDQNFHEPISKLTKGVVNVLKGDKKYAFPIDDYTMTTVLSLSVGMTKYPSTLDPAELVRVGGMNCRTNE
jgi:hypothetical protein